VSATIRVRIATREDAEEVFATHRDSVESQCREFYTDEQVAMWLEGRSPATYDKAISEHRILVATMSDEIAGFVEYAPGEIVKLFVKGSAARHGVGDMLMRAALAKARRGHRGPIRLESTKNAQGFYERRGFAKVGEGFFSRGGSSISLEIIQMEG
jgi:putative acetyltransferase